MSNVTLRPRFVLVVLAVVAVGTLASVAAGAGWFSLIGVALTAVAAFVCRQSLRLDDAGVRYRSLVPTEDFALAWGGVTQVVVDVVRTSTPGAPSSPVARATFVRANAASRSAILFSRGDADHVLAACRARNVDVIDARAEDEPTPVVVAPTPTPEVIRTEPGPAPVTHNPEGNQPARPSPDMPGSDPFSS